MRVIEPMEITDAVLTASNVVENDHAVWSAVTTYSAGNRVISTATHKVYESIAGGNLNRNPVTDLVAAFWITIGATNRWKAFDGIINDPVTRATSITYTMAPVNISDGMALFGLLASSVQLVVKSAAAATLFDQTIVLIDRTEQVTWFSWFYDPIDNFETEAIFTGFPGFPGNTIEITILGGASTQVGEIVTGRNQLLGLSLSGAAIGIEDFSRKERDDFGRATIVPRAFADTATFQFSFPPEDARRVKRVLTRLRASPAVWFAGVEFRSHGTTVFGFYNSFDIPITVGVCFATLEIEGLI